VLKWWSKLVEIVFVKAGKLVETVFVKVSTFSGRREGVVVKIFM